MIIKNCNFALEVKSHENLYPEIKSQSLLQRRLNESHLLTIPLLACVITSLGVLAVRSLASARTKATLVSGFA
jgi:hypothetical protein